MNIPLDSRLYYEKYVIRLNSLDVIELYTSLVNEDTLKRSLNDNAMYKEQISEKVYLCALASYSKSGKNYTFLVDEKSYHNKWKIDGTNTEVYFKRFKQIKESNLPCDITKMKKLIPILEDNVIKDDTYNFDLVSIDCKDTILIYNLILQNKEKFKNNRYFINYISDMEIRFFNPLIKNLKLCHNKIVNGNIEKEDFFKLNIILEDVDINILTSLKNVYNYEEIKSYFKFIFSYYNKEKLKLILEDDYQIFMLLISKMYLLTQDELYYEILNNYNDGQVYIVYDIVTDEEEIS